MKSSKAKLLFLAGISLLPSSLKCFVYRTFLGYKIGKNVKIGVSVLDAEECEIEDNVSIGHLNLFLGSKQLKIGSHCRIGHLNIVRGGDRVDLGKYSEILRLNEINSIPDPLVSNPTDPVFILGNGSVITTSHKIDFTDRVEIGKRVIIGGRNSSIWTHNRQQTEKVLIGDYSYVGSEIRIAPGGAIPANCVVGIGSVIVRPLTEEYQLIAGVPAKGVKELARDNSFTNYKTRLDLPDEI